MVTLCCVSPHTPTPHSRARVSVVLCGVPCRVCVRSRCSCVFSCTAEWRGSLLRRAGNASASMHVHPRGDWACPVPDPSCPPPRVSRGRISSLHLSLLTLLSLCPSPLADGQTRPTSRIIAALRGEAQADGCDVTRLQHRPRCQMERATSGAASCSDNTLSAGLLFFFELRALPHSFWSCWLPDHTSVATDLCFHRHRLSTTPKSHPTTTQPLPQTPAAHS